MNEIDNISITTIIWHDMSEKPGRDCDVLVTLVDRKISMYATYNSYMDSYKLPHISIAEFNQNKITHWAYVPHNPYYEEDNERIIDEVLHA